MKCESVLAVLLVIQATAATTAATTQVEIYSDPAQGPDLEDGLQSLVSGMTLLLHEGMHTLNGAVFVRDVTDVAIQGRSPSQGDVVITCSSGIGLAFFNTSNLAIRNVTIKDCGLNEERWDGILPSVNDTLVLTFEVPRDLSVGLFVAVSTDVTLENVVIEGTRGIGLIAITLLGSTLFKNVEFYDNKSPRPCVTSLLNIPKEYAKHIGGGAYILYQDLRRTLPSLEGHSLTVEDSTFARNRDCSITALVEIFIERSVELKEIGYTLGAGGGLTVMMAQFEFVVTLNITRSEFHNNQGVTGAGIHIGIFSGIPAITPIYVANCRFDNNGKDGKVISGGGMMVLIDLPRPAELRGELQLDDVAGGVNIEVERSMFTNNKASSGGGVAIVSVYAEQHAFDNTYRARFTNCTFRSNRAFGGSAMLVFEEKGSGFSPGLQLEISDCFVSKNSQSSDNVEAGGINDYGAVHVRNINVTLSGANIFASNLATALGCVASLLYVSGSVKFERNRAVNGAGMQLLSESFLILQPGARLSFKANRAEVYGASIYVDLNPDNFTFIPDNCFLYFNQRGHGICTDPIVCLPQNVTLEFRNNRARLGSVVYGSSLTTCPWVSTLQQVHPRFNSSETVYDNLRSYQKTFDLPRERENDARPEFSTPTRRLVVQPDLNTSIMPGVEFSVNVTAFDEFGQQIPEVVISSSIVDSQEENNITIVVIGDFGFFELNPQAQYLAPVRVLSDTIRNVTIRFSTLSLQSETLLTVSLTECSLGFLQSDLQCVCDSRLEEHGIGCNVNFTLGSTNWLGPIHDGDDVTNDDLTVDECVLNYCRDGTQDIASGDWDHRCRENFHRTGRLCGQCEDGYSLQLGTNACARCTNWYLFLLVFFFFAGIFIVFGMGILEISVSECFFTAIIFYSNIITLYSEFFINSEVVGTNFLTSFLSLNFGIPTCFYDGLDSLSLVALQLTFVTYLFLLTIIFILLEKKVSFRFVDYLHQKYSPSKALATLIMLSYVSILQSSFSIFSFKTPTTLDGKQHLWWYSDPTVDYFTGFHIFLWLVSAALLLFFLIPLPILFTFCTKAIYRWPYFNKFKPLYDALFAPYKNKFHPWLGIQIIIRIVLFFNAFFVPRPHLLLVAAVCLLLYLHFQSIFQPYKVKWTNRLESGLMMNALLFVLLTLYFGNLSHVSYIERLLANVILTLLAAIGFVYSFIRYAIERHPKTTNRIIALFKKRENDKKGAESPARHPPKILFVDSGGNHVREVQSSLTRKARSASVDYLAMMTDEERAARANEFEVTYTEFREPLLDEGEMEIANSYSVIISRNNSAGSTPAATPTTSNLTPKLGVRSNNLNNLNLPVDQVTPRNTA